MDYKDTIHLPKTDFPMKANLAQREPEIQRAWEAAGIYQQVLAQNAARPGARKFVLHDGPPYANGDIHIGHALNKILKDIIVKYRNQNGEVADYVPGWDCHGLPIELKVDKELGPKKRDMDRAAVIEACRAYAAKWIDKQRISFKRLGVFGRWETPYATMDKRYEADTVRALARAAERGFLVRGKKPVYWCITDRTALAEAEVEYEEHTSPSIHVAFDLTAPLPHEKLRGRAARLVIWTTTPWTLPANLAVAARADYVYVAYDLDGTVVVVAKDLLAAFLAACAPGELADGALAHPERLLAELEGSKLEGLTYRHPFMERESPVILGEHVTLEAGTGLVHTAPGHGAEDYLVGQEYRLEVLNPVDGAGVFTDGAGRVRRHEDLRGQPEDRGRPGRLRPPALRPQGHAEAQLPALLALPQAGGLPRHRPVVPPARPRRHAPADAGRDRPGAVDPALGPRPHLQHDREPARLVPVAPADLGRAHPGLLLRGLRRAAGLAGADEPGGRRLRAGGDRGLVPARPGRVHGRGELRARAAAPPSGASRTSSTSGGTRASPGRRWPSATPTWARRSTSTWRAPTSTAAGSTRRCSPAWPSTATPRTARC